MTLNPSALEVADAVFRVLDDRKGFDHIIGEIQFGDPETWAELREAVGSAAITAYLAALPDAERWRLEMGELRMCLNCAKTVPASHDRHTDLPECIDPDGNAACTFDHTPQEAVNIWSQRWHELYAENQRLRQSAVPEGWQLVPKVATEGMLQAAYDTEVIHQEYGEDSYVDNSDEIWTAMLAAAPKPGDAP